MRYRALALLMPVLAALATPVRASNCPPAPAPVVDITSNRFYTDPAHSIPDPVLVEKRQAAVKPLEDFRADVTRFASRGLAGNRSWSLCAGRWLAAWAEAGALLGRMSETQAHYERRWALSAIAMAYLMIKADLPGSDHVVIESWLIRVAEAVAADPAMRSRNPNNLVYWGGAALGAVASATGHAGHWATARRIYQDGLSHIQPDGSLPRETMRGRLALHYHNFALRPLILLAELSERRGEAGYASGNGAIHRLAALTLAGFLDPAPMARLAGVDQRPLERSGLGWLAFYDKRFPGRLSGARAILEGKDIWDQLAGGNASLIAGKGIP
jgi:poly(beta-D-mannuronate) lyase